MCRFCLREIRLVDKVITWAEQSTIGARLHGPVRHSRPLALTPAVVDVHVRFGAVDECSFPQHHIAWALFPIGGFLWWLGVGQLLLSGQQLGGSLRRPVWTQRLFVRHYLQKRWRDLLETRLCRYWEVLWGERAMDKHVLVQLVGLFSSLCLQKSKLLQYVKSCI